MKCFYKALSELLRGAPYMKIKNFPSIDYFNNRCKQFDQLQHEVLTMLPTPT